MVAGSDAGAGRVIVGPATETGSAELLDISRASTAAARSDAAGLTVSKPTDGISFGSRTEPFGADAAGVASTGPWVDAKAGAAGGAEAGAEAGGAVGSEAMANGDIAVGAEAVATGGIAVAAKRGIGAIVAAGVAAGNDAWIVEYEGAPGCRTAGRGVVAAFSDAGCSSRASTAAGRSPASGLAGAGFEGAISGTVRCDDFAAGAVVPLPWVDAGAGGVAGVCATGVAGGGVDDAGAVSEAGIGAALPEFFSAGIEAPTISRVAVTGLTGFTGLTGTSGAIGGVGSWLVVGEGFVLVGTNAGRD